LAQSKPVGLTSVAAYTVATLIGAQLMALRRGVRVCTR
jgi:hypothetical protein